MKKWLSLLFMLALLVACGDSRLPTPDAEDAEAITVDGPALVYFYTDN